LTQQGADKTCALFFWESAPAYPFVAVCRQYAGAVAFLKKIGYNTDKKGESMYEKRPL